jgi:hypothetical protein
MVVWSARALPAFNSVIALVYILRLPDDSLSNTSPRLDCQDWISPECRWSLMKECYSISISTQSFSLPRAVIPEREDLIMLAPDVE